MRFSCLPALRCLSQASGFEPRVIYDIGACVLHWARVAKEVREQSMYGNYD